MINPLEFWRDNTKAVWKAGAEMAPATHFGRALGLDKMDFWNPGKSVTTVQGPTDWEGQVEAYMSPTEALRGGYGDSREQAEQRALRYWSQQGRGSEGEAAIQSRKRADFDKSVQGSNFMDVLAANEPSMFRPKQATGQAVYSAPKV